VSKTRILLVDDHALFREGAARLLDAEPDIEVTGCCGSVEEALAILGSVQVDLVLLDVDLGKARGFHFFKPAREIGFNGRILVVAGVVGLFEARRLIQSGAAGIFLKQRPPNLLVDAIRAIMGGAFYIDPALRNYLDSEPGSSQPREELTSRDRAVWNGVVEGLTNKEIASRVHISEALVKVTLQQLFDKYGVRTRSQLVRIGLEQHS
jgi:two-component system, NarL family, nitrate/nitrite response regulator NarL